MHTPDRQCVPNIQNTEERGQKRHSELVAYGETPLTGASLGWYCNKTEFVPKITRQHPSEHSVGI